MPPRRILPFPPPRSVHFGAGATEPPSTDESVTNDSQQIIPSSASQAADVLNTSASAADEFFDALPSHSSTQIGYSIVQSPVTPHGPLIDGIENRISAEVIFNTVLSAPVLTPATPRAATPNPFLTPSDFLTPLGNENSGVQRPPPQSLEMSTIPGLFPVHGATPPLMLSDLHSANATTEQHLLDGGNTTAPSRTINNVDLQLTIVDETAIANEATTPVVPASDCVRDTTSSHHLASQPNVHLQTLDAGHTFDLVFIDLPSLDWLRPAWLEHDLNGRLLYRLQPPHLANVLVDLELGFRV
jgi:hypothetical protein